MKRRLYLATCLLALWVLPAEALDAFDVGLAPFEVAFQGKTVSHELLSFMVMPGEETTLTVPEDHRDGGLFEVEASGGALQPNGLWQWHWQAPEQQGLQTLHIRRNGRVGITINIFVLTPADRIRNGYLEGYRMGAYPREPLRGNPIYLAPEGFIRVTEDMQHLPISPHFTLGDFLCKQQPDHWPKFVLVRTELLVKLELILAEVNRRGIHTDGLVVMSGFRTPWYNQTLGNGAYSRHLWGGAADIFIDTTGDGRMDDLRGNGRVDVSDARMLHDVVEALFSRTAKRRLEGGLGLYGPRPHRGPFVHVDARGDRARWSYP